MSHISQLPDKDYSNIRNADVFRALYYDLLPFFENRRKVYEYLESIHEQKHGFPKYKTYESFYQSYRSYIDKINRASHTKNGTLPKKAKDYKVMIQLVADDKSMEVCVVQSGFTKADAENRALAKVKESIVAKKLGSEEVTSIAS